MGIFNRVTEASFKGVKFLATGAIETAGGRKTIDHIYPNSDRRFIEDLGKLQRDFTVTGIITDPNYFSNRDALINALESEGAGLFKHPFLGTFTVTAKPFTLVEDFTRIGEATFTMTFSIGEAQIQPTESGGFIISKLVTGVLDAIESVITTIWDITNPENFGAGASLMDDVFNAMDEVSNRQEVLADNIDQFNKTLLDARANVNSLIRSSADLASSFNGLYNNILLISTSPENSFLLFKDLFGFSSGEEIDPTTVSRTERKTNQDLMNESMNTAALAQAYQSAFLIDYSTDEELNSIVSALDGQYNSIIESLDDDLQNELQELRDEFRRFSDDQLLTVDKITTITVRQDIPVTVLAYQYYGSTESYDTLIDLNDLINPSEISGDVRILTR